jgi:hypothetical protein
MQFFTIVWNRDVLTTINIPPLTYPLLWKRWRMEMLIRVSRAFLIVDNHVAAQ